MNGPRGIQTVVTASLNRQIALFWIFPLLISGLTMSVVEANAAALGDDYLVENFTSEDGLPANTITSINQTPDGYLWFANFNSLTRFDGVKFTVFDLLV